MLALSIPAWTQRYGKDNSPLQHQEIEEIQVAFLPASC